MASRVSRTPVTGVFGPFVTQINRECVHSLLDGCLYIPWSSKGQMSVPNQRWAHSFARAVVTTPVLRIECPLDCRYLMINEGDQWERTAQAFVMKRAEALHGHKTHKAA